MREPRYPLPRVIMFFSLPRRRRGVRRAEGRSVFLGDNPRRVPATGQATGAGGSGEEDLPGSFALRVRGRVSRKRQ